MTDIHLRHRVFDFLDKYGLKGLRIVRVIVKENHKGRLYIIATHPLFKVSINTAFHWVHTFYDPAPVERARANEFIRMWVLCKDLDLRTEVEELEHESPHPVLSLVLSNLNRRTPA